MDDMYELIDENNPFLRVPATRITRFDDELEDLVQKMREIMVEHDGIGLAAPQIALPLRVFVMKEGDSIITCINPEILEEDEGKIVEEEGCLSFPELKLNIKRAVTIKVSYSTLDNEVVIENLDGLQARCFLHELDHLNGIIFLDRAPKLAVKLAKERRQKILRKIKRSSSC